MSASIEKKCLRRPICEASEVPPTHAQAVKLMKVLPMLLSSNPLTSLLMQCVCPSVFADSTRSFSLNRHCTVQSRGVFNERIKGTLV
eukprot:976539-Amphidinium_carterae.1